MNQKSCNAETFVFRFEDDEHIDSFFLKQKLAIIWNSVSEIR